MEDQRGRGGVSGRGLHLISWGTKKFLQWFCDFYLHCTMQIKQAIAGMVDFSDD